MKKGGIQVHDFNTQTQGISDLKGARFFSASPALLSTFRSRHSVWTRSRACSKRSRTKHISAEGGGQAYLCLCSACLPGHASSRRLCRLPRRRQSVDVVARMCLVGCPGPVILRSRLLRHPQAPLRCPCAYPIIENHLSQTLREHPPFHKSCFGNSEPALCRLHCHRLARP